MSNLSNDFKEKIYNKNKSQWDTDWNNRVKIILDNIEETDVKIHSIGETTNHSKKTFIFKYLMPIIKFNLNKRTEHNFISYFFEFYVLIYFFLCIFITICLPFAFSIIDHSYTSMIISFYIKFFSISAILVPISISYNNFTQKFNEYIFYSLNSNFLCFYKISDEENKIKKININLIDILKIKYNSNYYYIETKQGNTFSIISEDRIPEIERLFSFHLTKDETIEKKKKEELHITEISLANL